MKKKKYSKRTLAAAKVYGATKGWKKLSQNRIRIFLDAVFRAKGYTTIQAIESFAQTVYSIYQREKDKLIEAARIFGSKKGWDKITEKRLKEFLSRFEEYCAAAGILRPTYDDAMDFALDYEEDEITDEDLDEYEEDYEDFEGSVDYKVSEDVFPVKYIVSDNPGWDNPDALDEHLRMPNFMNVDLIDFDGSLVYSGPDRRDLWDAIRELGSEGVYPVYDAYYVEDEYGNTFITVKVKGYYP